MSEHSCPWWARWLHRRRREADRRFMFPALTRAAQAQNRPAGSLAEAWHLFLAQPGQEHWRCACANQERAERFLRMMADEAE